MKRLLMMLACLGLIGCGTPAPHSPCPPTPNCQCGCTETGKCVCKDCDHPKLVK